MNPNFLHGMPNLQLIIFPTSRGECGNTTWVSEGVSPSEENTTFRSIPYPTDEETFRSIPYPTDEEDIDTGKVEVGNGKNVPMEQSNTSYIYLGVSLLIIIIGAVLVVIVVRRKRIGSKYFLNSQETTVCPGRLDFNATS
jgi:hypothetical protein